MITLTRFTVASLVNDVVEFTLGGMVYRTITQQATKAVYHVLRDALSQGDTPLEDIMTTIQGLGARRVL